MGAKGVAQDKTEQGPSWQDVYAMWRDLEEGSGTQVELRFRLTRGADGRRGMRGLLTPVGSGQRLATIGFGPTHADSAKTLPAALYLAMLQASEELAAQRLVDDGDTVASVAHFFSPPQA